MSEYALIALIVVAAAFLQGLTGFGFVLIALPLLDFIIDIKTSIPFMTLLAVCISLTLSIQLRHSIQFKSIAVLMVATIPGIPLGVYLLKTVPPSTLAVCVGILMVSFTAYQLLASPTPRHLKNGAAITAGFLSGTLAASISAGGPPAIIYSALQPWTKDQAKATLACYFTLSGFTVAITHAYTGLTTAPVLKLFAISLPAMFFGIFLGTTAYKRLSDHGYRKLAFILVFVLGCVMLYRNI